MRKELLLLAKSYKHGGFCLGGCEIVRGNDGRNYLTSHWVRPVTINNEGESTGCVPAHWCRDIAVMDIIEVEFQGHSPVVGQPENWLMRPGAIRKVCDFTNLAALAPLSAGCPPLWRDSSRIRFDQIGQNSLLQQAACSLMLISPQDLVFTLELKEVDGRARRNIYASFSYAGIRYEHIKATDPVLIRLFKNQFPLMPGQQYLRRLNHGDAYYLTMSLSPCFVDGFHYVLLAAVIDKTGYLNRNYR